MKFRVLAIILLILPFMTMILNVSYAVGEPPAPSNFYVNYSDNGKAIINWKDNATDEFNYSISLLGEEHTLPANSTSYTFNNLPPNANFQYTLSVTNAAGTTSINKTFSTPTDHFFEANYLNDAVIKERPKIFCTDNSSTEMRPNNQQNVQGASSNNKVLITWYDDLNQTACWSDEENGNPDIYGQIFDRNTGANLSSPFKITTVNLWHLSTSAYPSIQTVASNGSDFMVTWMDTRNSSGRQTGVYNILAARISNNGTVIDQTPIFITNYSSNTSVGYWKDTRFPKIASDGDNYLITWLGDGKLFAKRINSSGNILDLNPIEIGPALSFANDLYDHLIYTGTNYLATWYSNNGYAAVRLDSNASKIDVSPHIISGIYHYNSVATDNNQYVFPSYDGASTKIQRYDANFNLIEEKIGNLGDKTLLTIYDNNQFYNFWFERDHTHNPSYNTPPIVYVDSIDKDGKYTYNANNFSTGLQATNDWIDFPFSAPYYVSFSPDHKKFLLFYESSNPVNYVRRVALSVANIENNIPAKELYISKSVDKTNPKRGEIINYKIYVSVPDSAKSDVNGINIFDTIDNRLLIISTKQNGFVNNPEVSDNNISLYNAKLAIGTTASISVQVQVK